MRFLMAAVHDLEHAQKGEEATALAEVLADLRQARDEERAKIESKCAELCEMDRTDHRWPSTVEELCRTEWDAAVGALTRRARSVGGTLRSSWRTGTARPEWHDD